jgi:hypothetical protein
MSIIFALKPTEIDKPQACKILMSFLFRNTINYNGIVCKDSFTLFYQKV